MAKAPNNGKLSGTKDKAHKPVMAGKPCNKKGRK